MSQNFETFQKILNKFNNGDVNNDVENLNCINNNLNHQQDTPNNFFLNKFWNSAKKICENPVTNFNISLTNIYNNYIVCSTESTKSHSTTNTSQSIKTDRNLSNYKVHHLKKHFTANRDNSIYKQAAENLYNGSISIKNKKNLSQIQSKIQNFNDKRCCERCTSGGDNNNNMIKKNRLKNNITRNTKPLTSKNSSVHIYRLNSKKSANLSIWQKAAKELYDASENSATNVNLLPNRKKRLSKTLRHDCSETSSTMFNSTYSSIKNEFLTNERSNKNIAANNSCRNLGFIGYNKNGCERNTCCTFVTTDIALAKGCNLFDDGLLKYKNNKANFNKYSDILSINNDKSNISENTSVTSSLTSYRCKKIWKKAAKELCKLHSEISDKKTDKYRDKLTSCRENNNNNLGYCSNSVRPIRNTFSRNQKLLKKYYKIEPETKVTNYRNLMKALNERICSLNDCKNVSSNEFSYNNAVKEDVSNKGSFNITNIDDDKTLSNEEIKLMESAKCQKCINNKLIIPTKSKSFVELHTNKSDTKNEMRNQNYIIVTGLSKSLPTELNFPKSCNIYKKCFSEEQFRHQNAKMNKCRTIHKRALKYKQETKVKPGNLILERNLAEKKSNNSTRKNEIICPPNNNTVNRYSDKNYKVLNDNYKRNIIFNSNYNSSVNYTNSIEKGNLELPDHNSYSEVSISNESIANSEPKIKSHPNLGCSYNTNYLNYNNMKFNNYYRVTLTCNPALFGGRRKNKKPNEGSDNLKTNGGNDKLFPTNESNEAQMFKKPQPAAKKESEKHRKKEERRSKARERRKKRAELREARRRAAEEKKKQKDDDIDSSNAKRSKSRNKKSRVPQLEEPGQGADEDKEKQNVDDEYKKSDAEKDTTEDSISSYPSSDRGTTDNTSSPSTSKTKRSSQTPSTNSEPVIPPQYVPPPSRQGSASTSGSSRSSFNSKKRTNQTPNSKLGPISNRIFFRKSPPKTSPKTSPDKPPPPVHLIPKPVETKASQTEPYHHVQEPEPKIANVKRNRSFCSYCRSCKCLPHCKRRPNSVQDSRKSSQGSVGQKAQCYAQSLTWLVNNLNLYRSVGPSGNQKSLEKTYCNQCIVKPAKPCCSRSACMFQKIFCCCRPDCSFKESLKRMFCISLPSKTSSETRTCWLRNKQPSPNHRCTCAC